MSQRLNIKRVLSARSDRVKSVDIHPSEPWVLASLYNGSVYLWNYNTQELVKSFEVTELPVRAARFIARKQWIVVGADDMQIRVYNYNTLEKVKQFEAHSDFIRCLAVHPTQPFVLSSSDDMTIKLWDWEKGWQCAQVFEGHSHYVMQVAFNPKDTNTFASASLDRTIKVWGLGSTTAHFTLEGHDKGVNCVEYYVGGDKPYLISGSDDQTVKVWDYHHKTCVQTLEGHTHNVSVIAHHPTLNVILSGSEDGTVRIWHASTYRLEKTLNYGLERVWAISLLKGSNHVAIGYDEGAIMIKLASESPAASMDPTGKIIWARHTEIQTVNVRGLTGAPPADGERLTLPIKELGTCEFYPTRLQHNSNGRFVAVCGDGEYVIYTALAWRNKTFGSAVEFVWGPDAGEYAVRETSGRVKLFRNFKETRNFRPAFNTEGMHGGPLLGLRSQQFICFYDWSEARLVRRVDVSAQQVFWSDNGELLAITTDSAFYVLRYARDRIQKTLDSGQPVPEDGFEEAFEVLHEVGEKVRTAQWLGDCFVYTNSQNRLNYCVGGEVSTIAHLDRKLYLLGYLPQENRLYLIDKSLAVVSYTLHLNVVNYQTLVLRGDTEAADRLLPSIPKDQYERLSLFLEAQNLREKALEMSTDPEHRFELALQLQRLDLAHTIAKELQSEDKWRLLADLSLQASKFALAEECMWSGQDLNGLLLLYTSLASSQGLARLGQAALDTGKTNVAFVCFLLTQQLERCIDLLCSTGRVPEAAFFARTYLPSQVSRLVQLWREDLSAVNVKAAQALADPMEYANLFPDLPAALQVEELLRPLRSLDRLPPSTNYPAFVEGLSRNLIEEVKTHGRLLVEGISLEDLAKMKTQAAAQAPPPAQKPAEQQQPSSPPQAQKQLEPQAPVQQPAQPPAQAQDQPPASPPAQPKQQPAAAQQSSPAPSPVQSPAVSPQPQPKQPQSPTPQPQSPASPPQVPQSAAAAALPNLASPAGSPPVGKQASPAVAPAVASVGSASPVASPEKPQTASAAPTTPLAAVPSVASTPAATPTVPASFWESLLGTTTTPTASPALAPPSERQAVSTAPANLLDFGDDDFEKEIDAASATATTTTAPSTNKPSTIYLDFSEAWEEEGLGH